MRGDLPADLAGARGDLANHLGRSVGSCRCEPRGRGRGGVCRVNDGSSTIVGVTDRPVLVTGDGHNRFGQPLDLTDGPVDARLISADMAPDGSIAVAWVAGG